MGRARTPIIDRLAGEQGSFLVEVMVSAVIVLIVGVGVLTMVDRSNAISGQQRTGAIAANLAQTEIERVKSLPLAQLSNLRTSTPTAPIGGVVYTVTTRADWVNDVTQAPNCTTPGATADYLKVKTTVTYPSIGSRRPATLDTIVTPPVRAFDPSQGSLSVLLVDRLSAPLSGVSVALTGPATFTDDTNVNGCILWGYLPVGNYNLSFVRTGWVTNYGTAGTGTATVVSESPTKVTYMFDRGGVIKSNFTVKDYATDGGAIIATKPQWARVESLSATPPFSKNYDLGNSAVSPAGANPALIPAGSTVDTTSSGLLFPFTQSYSVYTDQCASALPAAPVTTTLAAGATNQANVQLPALYITAKNGSSASAPVVTNGTVKVVTSCGTAYSRPTNSLGQLDDPGFPSGTNHTICVSSPTVGKKKVLTAQANTAIPGTTLTVDVNSGTSGNAAFLAACP